MNDLEIKSDMIAVKADKDTAINIYRNQNDLQYTPISYYRNPQMYEDERKQMTVNLDAMNYPVTAQTLLNTDLQGISKYYIEQMQAIEDATKRPAATTQVKPSFSFFDAVTDNVKDVYNSYRFTDKSTDLSLLYTDLSNAEDGSDAEKNILAQIDVLKAEIAKMPQPQGDISTVIGNIASFYTEGRSLLGMGAGAVAGGATAFVTKNPALTSAASIAANGAVIYDFTHDIEYGSMYAYLLENNPEMTKEERKEISEIVGTLNGGIETALSPMAIGGSVVKILKGAVTRAVLKSANKELLLSAVKNPSKLKTFAKWAAETVMNAGSEATEEVMQNMVNEQVEQMIAGEQTPTLKETALATAKETLDFFKTIATTPREQWSENVQQNYQTLVDVAIGSAIFGTAFKGVANALTGRKQSVVGGKQNENILGSDIVKTADQRVNEAIAQQAKVDGYMEVKRNNPMTIEAPELQDAVMQGVAQNEDNIDGAYIDTDVALQLLDASATEPNLKLKTDALDLQNKIEKAEAVGEKVLISPEQMDKIIYDTEDDALFQKIKSNMTFDDTALSTAEVSLMMQQEFDKVMELNEQLGQTDTFLKRVYDTFISAGFPEGEAKVNTIKLDRVLRKEAEVIGVETTEDVVAQTGLEIVVNPRTQEEELRTAENTPVNIEVDTTGEILEQRLDEGGRGRGYIGYSMSVNMAEAQANNELPASKAAKELGVSTQAIREVLLPTAWHHASSYYNEVNVYDINPYLELKQGRELDTNEYTAEEIAEIKDNWEKLKNFPKPDKNVEQFYGDVKYLEWSGTRQHPKATEHSYENILIEKKGSFYTFHLPNGETVRKKIDSNGTSVISEEQKAEEKRWAELVKRRNARYTEIMNSYREEYQEEMREFQNPTFEFFETHMLDNNMAGDNFYIAGQKPLSADKEVGLRRIHITSKNKYQLQRWNGDSWEVLETRDTFNRVDWQDAKEGQPSLRSFVSERSDEYRKLSEAYSSDTLERALRGEQVLEQRVTDVVAGTFDPQTMLLTLTQHSNPTSFAHELFHYHTKVLINEYNKGNRDSHYMRSFASAVKWAGGRITENGQVELPTEGWEKLANGFTTYLKEGRAPTENTRGFFSYLRQLFGRTYQLLRNLPQVRLNKVITDFYDQLFLTDAQVEQELNNTRLGTVARPANVTNEQWDAYLNTVEKAKGDATTAGIEAATNLANKRSSEEYQAKFNEAKQEALSNLETDVNLAIVDRVALLGIRPESIEGILPDGVTIPAKYIKRYGLSVDAYINDFNLQSITELAQILNETASREETANAIASQQADEWLVGQYPELKDVGIANATRTIAATQAYVYEYMMLRGIPLERFNMYYNNLIAAVEESYAGRPVRELANIERLQQKLINAAERYRVAERANDRTNMAKFRYRMAALNYAIARGKTLATRVQKFDRHFTKYKTRATESQVKAMDNEAYDIISAVLNKYGYTKRAPVIGENIVSRVTDYVKNLQQRQFTMLDPLIDNAQFLANAQGSQARTLTTAEFNQLDALLRMLETAGRTSKALSNAFNKELINVAGEKVAAYYAKKKFNPWQKDDELKNMFIGKFAMKEAYLKEKLPDDVFLEYVLPFIQSTSKATVAIDNDMKTLSKILKGVVKKEKKNYVIDGRTYTYKELAFIMFNTGNSHNIDCTIKTLQQKFGDNFTRESYFSLINQIPKELRGVAQEVWSFFEGRVQAFRDASERVTGRRMKLVQAEPIMFEDGEVLTGGYFPAGKKPSSEAQDYQSSMNMDNSKYYPLLSYSQERTSLIHGDLDFSWPALESYVLRTDQFIHIAEAYNNLTKLLNNRNVQAVMGEGATFAMNSWMENTINPPRVWRFLNTLNNFSIVSTLGWAPWRHLIQLMGVIPSMASIGPHWIVYGATKFALTGRFLDVTMSRAKRLSPYMNERFGNVGNALADLRQTAKIGGKVGAGIRSIQNMAMWSIAYFDMFASVITWEGAYAKERSRGRTHEQAVALADSAVRTTQGDSTAVSRVPAVMGNLKFLSPYMTYFIAMYSQFASKLAGRHVVQALGMLFAAGVLSPALEIYIRGLHDWEGADDRKKERWRRLGIYTFEDYIQHKIPDNVINSTTTTLFPFFQVGNTLGQYLTSGKVYAFEPAPVKQIRSILTTILGGGEHIIDGTGLTEQDVNNIFLAFGSNLPNIRSTVRATENVLDDIAEKK